MTKVTHSVTIISNYPRLMDLILQKLKLIHIKDLNIHDPGFLEIAFLTTMAIRVVEFSNGGGGGGGRYKIRKMFV